eukprot:9213947-Lingulodinium_polyedra.AAC.1
MSRALPRCLRTSALHERTNCTVGLLLDQLRIIYAPYVGARGGAFNTFLRIRRNSVSTTGRINLEQ